MIAIVRFEVNQGLRLVGISGYLAQIRPIVQDGVGFGRQMFQPFQGAFLKVVACIFLSVMKQKRHDGIDKKKV